MEVGFEDGLQHQLRRHMHRPIAQRRNAERTLSPVRLLDKHLSHRLRSVGSLPQRPLEFIEKALDTDTLRYMNERLPVHPRPLRGYD